MQQKNRENENAHMNQTGADGHHWIEMKKVRQERDLG